jgi:hypothetical protein
MVMNGYLFDKDGWFRFRFLLCMAILVYTQAPLAMAGVTIKLGNLMFGIQSSKQQTLKAIGKQWFSVFGVLGILQREPCVCLLCRNLLDRDVGFDDRRDP